MKRKKYIYLIILLIVIILTNLIISLDNNETEKKQILLKLGITFDPEKFLDSDMDLDNDGKKVIVQKSGSEKPIEVSNVKGTIIIEFPEGGIIIDEKTNDEMTKGQTYVFSKGSKVKVVDGKVILEDVVLEKGTVIAKGEFYGHIERFDSLQNMIITKKGKEIVYNGYKYSPSNEESLNIRPGEVYSKEESVISGIDGKIIGRFKSGAIITNIEGKSFMFVPESGKIGTFVNNKETRFELNQKTEFCPFGKCEGDKINQNNRIEYNGDLRVIAKSNSDNFDKEKNIINIFANDGSYENIIFPKISDEKSEIKLDLTTEINEKSEIVSFEFSSNNPPLVKGNLANLKSNIANMFISGEDKTQPWFLFKGEVVDGNKIGEINKDFYFQDFKDIENNEIKKLLIKTIDLDNVNKDGMLMSALMSLEGQPEIVEFLADRMLNHYEDKSLANMFFLMANDNPNLQKKLFDQLDFTYFDSGVMSDFLMSTKNDIEMQKKLLEKYDGFLEHEDIERIIENNKEQTDIDSLRTLLHQKANGISDINAFKNSETEKQKEIIQNAKFYTMNKLKETLASAKDEEVKKMILQRTKYEIDTGENLLKILEQTKGNKELQELVFKIFKPELNSDSILPTDISQAVTLLDPDLASQLLSEYSILSKITQKKKNSPWFDPKIMSEIYSNQNFLELTKDIDEFERWSIAVSVSRDFEQAGKVIDKSKIGEATKDILKTRNDFAPVEIYGPTVKTMIVISNDGKWPSDLGGKDRFTQDKIFNLGKDSGVSDDAMVRGLIGPEKKSLMIESIKNSKDKTTIYFDGHGGPEHQWVGEGELGNEVSDDMHHPDGISYVEFGDTLLERAKNGENLRDVVIILESCISYDYAKNLYSYLEKNGKGIISPYDLPILMAITNRGQTGSNFLPDDPEAIESGHFSQLTYALQKVKEQGKPLILRDAYKSEKYFFKYQDAAIFVPTKDGIKILGSSNDDPETLELEVKEISQNNQKPSPSSIQYRQIENRVYEGLV